MRTSLLFALLILLFQSACNSTTERSPSFSFIETDGKIELLEGSDPVMVYQKALKSPNGKDFFNNYIHPLYSLDGDAITEEFPADHLHHRGIFWAWHHIFVDTFSIGDGWIMDGFFGLTWKQHSSMQNIVFPGRDKVPLSMESPTVLQYRLILHDRSADRFDIAKFQSDYNKKQVN